MSEQATKEEELFVLKNPFKEKLGEIIISSIDALKPTKPGLPIDGKVYTIPQNVISSDYAIHSITQDTSTRSISGNIGTLLRVQNNHTEILTYLVNILFNEINEPVKRMLMNISNKLDKQQSTLQESQYETPSIELGTKIILLKTELEEMKNEIRKTNSNLEKLLQKI